MDTINSSNNQRKRIDLHLHSNLSDGENTVDEIIELAHQECMRVVALSDHNLFAIKKKIQTGQGNDCLEIIPACEFSTTYCLPLKNKTIEVHVIGIFPGGVDLEEFSEIFQRKSEGKLNYISAIIDQLVSLGIDISMEEVLEVKRRTGHLGRHQVADILIQKGCVESVDEAFDRYIGNHSKYYIPTTDFINYASMDVVVKKIKSCGGLPILCHPFEYSFNPYEIESLVKYFTESAEGIGGIEVYYEKYLNDLEKMELLKKLQIKYGLLISAASDRHRRNQSFASCGEYSYYQEMLKVMIENDILKEYKF